MKIKRDDYISDEVKQLEIEVKQKTKRDRELAVVRNIISKFSVERKQVILDELSRELAVKGNIK